MWDQLKSPGKQDKCMHNLPRKQDQKQARKWKLTEKSEWFGNKNGFHLEPEEHYGPSRKFKFLPGKEEWVIRFTT